MSQLFRNLPLPLKLTLIAVVPLVFTLFLTLQLINEKKRSLDSVEAYHRHIATTQHIIDLTNELQTELRLSYVHILRKDSTQSLLRQRHVNDSLIQVLQTEKDPAMANFTAYTFLNDLPSMRRQIDSHRVQPATVTSFYINAIYRLHSMSNIGFINNGNFHTINKAIAGQKLLAQMINFYGIMRLNIYNVLYTKQDALGTLYGLRGVYDIYKSFEKELLLQATPSIVSDYRNTRARPPFSATMSYLDSLFSRYGIDSTYSAERWWLASQQSIDQLKSIRREIKKDIENNLAGFHQSVLRDRNRSYLLLSICLVVIAVLILYTVQVLNKMLGEIKNAAEKITAGVTGITLPSYPNDVIGKLARCIRQMDSNNRQLAETAQAIGKGDFTVPVQARSKEDMLGNAILQMKEGLKHLTEQEKQRHQQITKAVLQGQEKERARIGEELHDNINQLLTSVNLYLHFMETEKRKREELLPKSREVLALAMEEIRKLSKQLVLPGLRGESLEQSIEDLVQDILETSPIRFRLEIENINEKELSEALKVNIYRIIQEQLKNVLKYANATQVLIRLQSRDNGVLLTLEDNGKGFDARQPRKGIGLSNIFNRAEAFNGEVDIVTAPGRGCRLEVYLQHEKQLTTAGFAY